jgi:predicted PurR-regulated permease PerM
MQHPSIFQPVLILAAAAILLVAMRLGATIVNQILMACFIAALLSPIYGGLKRWVPGGLAALMGGAPESAKQP